MEDFFRLAASAAIMLKESARQQEWKESVMGRAPGQDFSRQEAEDGLPFISFRSISFGHRTSPMNMFRIRRSHSAQNCCDPMIGAVETLYAAQAKASFSFSPHVRLLPLRLMDVHFGVFGNEH